MARREGSPIMPHEQGIIRPRCLQQGLPAVEVPINGIDRLRWYEHGSATWALSADVHPRMLSGRVVYVPHAQT